jgi:type I restriction enzyme, R subunit
MVIKADFTSLASPDLAVAWSFWLTGLPDHGDRKSGKILQGRPAPRTCANGATGSVKTYTAITSVYRLLKYADAKRVLFLVDTKNLGEQAEQEFMAYLPNDDNRKFTELYNVQRLKSSFVAKDSQVCISTIQRMYALLKDEPLDEKRPKQSLPVVYNEKISSEFFDFIIIDECHRSIYNLWRQVIEYFDAVLSG